MLDSSEWFLRCRLSMGGLCLPPSSPFYNLAAPHPSWTACSLLNSLLIHASVPLYILFLLLKCSPTHTSPIWKIAACLSRNDPKVFFSVKPFLTSLSRIYNPLSLFKPLYLVYILLLLLHYQWILEQKLEKFGVQRRVGMWMKGKRMVRGLLQSLMKVMEMEEQSGDLSWK